MKLHAIAIAAVVLSFSAGPGFSASDSTSYAYNAVEQSRCVQAKNDGDQGDQLTYCPPNERF